MPLDEATRLAADAAGSVMAVKALRLLAVPEIPAATLDEAGGFAQFQDRAVFLGSSVRWTRHVTR